MFMKFYFMVFLSSLVTGTIMASSASSWSTAWLGLEINLMSFIPIILTKPNHQSSEAAIKYFLVQAMASLLIISASICFNKHFPLNSFIETNSLLVLALAMKSGMAPTHFWFPQVMELSGWMQATILLTWQKIAPLILLPLSSNNWLGIFIASSAMVGMLGGLNQNSLKKILTYSSISHLAWMVSALMYSEKIWWLYFSIYATLSVLAISPLFLFDIKTFNKLNILSFKSPIKLLFLINFLSLAGLPPFIGFLPKMILLANLLIQPIMVPVMLTLIVSSLISLFFYLRITFSSLMVFEPSNLINSSWHSYSLSTPSWLVMLSIGSNCIAPPLVLFF